ncbi:MAG TPA: type I phosphomannose isomerase catalytic subunit [Candidatus Acidoferrum sp.]|nr:type I phosphomannose isomerase catalytic subunit [Candidatus Acidoferrum sp.]
MSAWPIAPEPFRIEPVFSERLWGSRSLLPFFPEMRGLKSPIGEAWLTSLDCRIANGQFAGQLLGQAWKEMTIPWRGSNFEGEADFPLLLKFIFPTDKLSIQVHPDDAYAAAHEAAAGGRGKTEMWYVVSANPAARLLAGLKPGVTKERFLAALADHTLEDLFQSYEVNAGDTFFIPAGTPHTIGPGMVICEVQEYSDLTYRLYDYDRRDPSGKPRELHVDKALEVMNFGQSGGGKVDPRPHLVANRKLGEYLVDCPYFETERLEFDQLVHFNLLPGPPVRFSLWIFLEGEGVVGWSCNPHDMSRYNSGDFQYNQGECWLVPAAIGSHGFYTKKKTSVLIASPRNPRHGSEKRRDAN